MLVIIIWREKESEREREKEKLGRGEFARRRVEYILLLSRNFAPLNSCGTLGEIKKQICELSRYNFEFGIYNVLFK